MKARSKNLIQLALFAAVLFLNFINANADTIYVWSNDSTIQKFTTNGVGTVVTNNLSGWNGPVGLVCDNVGNLYAGVPGESYVWKFPADGTRSLVAYIDSISGLAFDSAGILFATIPNYGEILKPEYGQAYGYNGFYYFGNSTNYTQAHLRYPINLVFDSAGNFYTANNINANPYSFLWPPSLYDNTVENYSSSFTVLGSFATGLNQPWGLAFGSGGKLYVANSGTNGSLNNTIVRFTPAGIRSTFATAISGLSSPRGLAFDSAGNLYVANSGNGTIQKFTTNGTGSVFASGLNSPSSIAIFPGLNVWSATTIKLANPKTLPNGIFQFDFFDNPGLSFTVLATTNLSQPKTNWTALGGVTEISPGQFQFTDPQATNNLQRFYQIHSP